MAYEDYGPLQSIKMITISRQLLNESYSMRDEILCEVIVRFQDILDRVLVGKYSCVLHQKRKQRS